MFAPLATTRRSFVTATVPSRSGAWPRSSSPGRRTSAIGSIACSAMKTSWRTARRDLHRWIPWGYHAVFAIGRRRIVAARGSTIASALRPGSPRRVGAGRPHATAPRPGGCDRLHRGGVGSPVRQDAAVAIDVPGGTLAAPQVSEGFTDGDGDLGIPDPEVIGDLVGQRRLPRSRPLADDVPGPGDQGGVVMGIADEVQLRTASLAGGVFRDQRSMRGLGPLAQSEVR